MGKKFQMVCGLWVTPDFSQVLAGRAQPPRVNHMDVDFAALAEAIAALFPYGPPVEIQIPNDTIDQVAVHVRQSGKHGASMRCEDFGQALLRCAKLTKDSIIDVRSAWAPLHALPDRAFAPPPTILPFVVTAVDFEDAMIWHASTRPGLGLPMYDPTDSMLNPDKKVPANGSIPAEFRTKLKAIFGTPYEPMAVLDRMAMDAAPREYGLG